MIRKNEFPKTSLVINRLYKLMNPCTLCPRKCGVMRSQGQLGYCKVDDKPKISSVGPHFGEESVLVGHGGSGTIFFAGCNLGCVYCQNFRISHQCSGESLTVSELAGIMLDLQSRGCENINLVSPSHQAPAIAAALELAHNHGLRLPIVYNTGGYDCVQILMLLDGLIDIYMPDMKYADPENARLYSEAPDYPGINFAAIKEMHRQVGDLRIIDGSAQKGLLVRHLVLPNHIAGSREIIDFLATQVSPETAVNIMDQYQPAYRAGEFDKLSITPALAEVEELRRYAQKKGLRIIN